MKVLHLLQSNRFSGAENVVCQIISMFKGDKNIEMIYCSRDGQIREALREKNIPFIPINELNFNEVRRVIDKVKPDIIHAHDFSASVIASFATLNIPVISHLHCNPPWLSKIDYRSIMYLIAQIRIKKILTVSDAVMNEYIFGKFIKGKASVIGNPIDTRMINQKANKAPLKRQSDIMFLGRMSTPKNPLLFVDIIGELKKQIPDVKAIMVGSGEIENQVKNRIHRKNLSNNIEMLGFQENPYGLLANTKILCMPSLWEGFGLAAVEALSLGKPVVCSKVGGLTQIVNCECGYVCQKAIEFVNALKILLFDFKQYEQLSDKALSRAKMLNNLVSYREALSSSYYNSI